MKKTSLTLLFLAIVTFTFAQTKVIDMHVHSYSNSDFGEREPATDHYGVKGATDAQSHRLETVAAFKKLNIVKAAVSGNPESVEAWAKNDPENIVIRGILMFSPDDYGMTVQKIEQLVIDKKIEIFGEVAPYYSGGTLSDSIWQP